MAELKHVYVIGPADGPYKVGIAADIKRRLTAIQTSSATRVAVHLHSPAIPNALNIEARMHGLLSAFRLMGEWFDCDLDTIRDAFSRFAVEATEPNSASPTTATQYPEYTPSGEAFRAWLDAMRRTPPSHTESQCAAALGVTMDELEEMKRNGTDVRTALACRALFHRLEPWA